MIQIPKAVDSNKGGGPRLSVKLCPTELPRITGVTDVYQAYELKDTDLGLEWTTQAYTKKGKVIEKHCTSTPSADDEIVYVTFIKSVETNAELTTATTNESGEPETTSRIRDWVLYSPYYADSVNTLDSTSRFSGIENGPVQANSSATDYLYTPTFIPSALTMADIISNLLGNGGFIGNLGDIITNNIVNDEDFITQLGDTLINNGDFITNLGDTLINNENFVTNLGDIIANNIINNGDFVKKLGDQILSMLSITGGDYITVTAADEGHAYTIAWSGEVQECP